MTRTDDASTETSLSAGEQILELSLQCSELVTAITRSTFILKQKRTTLEEKAISRYLHQCSKLLGLILAKLHESLAERTEENLPQPSLDLLRETTVDLRNRVDELLKILHYNLNFLEQYFEYDYLNKLANESEALEKLQRVFDALPSAATEP